MPSFLDKVLGRKKEDKGASNKSSTSSEQSPLGGKFERVSPTAAKFPTSSPTDGQKDKDKGGPFSVLRMKSKDSSSKSEEEYYEPRAPKLSLFLGPSSQQQTLSHALEAELRTMSDADIGKSRLSPEQALALVQACAKGLADRGLETLGIMHPHWYSASPDTQRRLISLFLHSLASNDPVLTSNASASFSFELDQVRSPHDVAAVLRWGVRHLQLERTSFGEEEDWYKKFHDSERDSSFPQRSYTQQLAPLVRNSHFELLTALLDTVSSLAAHAESNGMSGSKMTKFIGLWLLTAQRASRDDDWTTFYDRWDKYGRMLEHIFLAYIRDEADRHQMPRRLTELVKHYPYARVGVTSDDGFLPRPRFGTRHHHALHIQVATELANRSPKPPRHPLLLISDAFKADTPDIESDGAYTDVWENIRSAVAQDQGSLQQVFSDETIRHLSMLPKLPGLDISQLGFFFDRSDSSSHKAEETMSPSSFASVESGGEGRRISFDHVHPVTSGLGIDWNQFSTSGFLNSEATPASLSQTLLDKDVEISSPPIARSASKRGRKTSPTQLSRSNTVLSEQQTSFGSIEAKYAAKVTPVGVVPIDEAFVDFWSDAILDPIASNWPAFALCKLKPALPGLDVEGKNVEYLVLERTFVLPPAPLLPPIMTTQIATDSAKTPKSPRATSPLPSLKNFSPSIKKRFSMWTAPSAKKTNGSSKVDELGVAVDKTPKPSLDMLREKDETPTGASAVAAISEETEEKAIATALPPSIKDEDAVAEIPAIAEQSESHNVKADVPVSAIEKSASDAEDVAAPTEPAVEAVATTLNDSPPSPPTGPTTPPPVVEANVEADNEHDLPTPVPTNVARTVLEDIPTEDSQPPHETVPAISEPITPPSVDMTAQPKEVVEVLPEQVIETTPSERVEPFVKSEDIVSTLSHEDDVQQESAPAVIAGTDEPLTKEPEVISTQFDEIKATPVENHLAASEHIPEEYPVETTVHPVATPTTTTEVSFATPTIAKTEVIPEAEHAVADDIPRVSEAVVADEADTSKAAEVGEAPKLPATDVVPDVEDLVVDDAPAIPYNVVVEAEAPKADEAPASAPELEDVIANIPAAPEAEPSLDITVPEASLENTNVHTEPVRIDSPTPQEETVLLSPVPVVEVDPILAIPSSPIRATEPIQDDSTKEEAESLTPIPISDADPSLAAPAVSSTPIADPLPITSALENVQVPPSLEGVVDAGSTPSPQVLLDSAAESEPAAQELKAVEETESVAAPPTLEILLDSGSTPSPQVLLDAAEQEPGLDAPVVHEPVVAHRAPSSPVSPSKSSKKKKKKN